MGVSTREGYATVKHLSSVFSCTSARVWVESKNELSGAAEVARFCDIDTVSMDGQCMDNDPTVQCYGSQHRIYIGTVLVMLMPYYVAALELQRSAQARQTVVTIDGGWLVVTMQSKVLLAVIASSFGDCFPIVSAAHAFFIFALFADALSLCVSIQVMVASVEVVVLAQLIMSCVGLDYSNVHSLNAIRIGGLVMAALNGLYAIFVLGRFRDDAAPVCSMTALDSGVAGSSSSAHSPTPVRLVHDYSTFFGLLGINAGAVAYGALCSMHVLAFWHHVQFKNRTDNCITISFALKRRDLVVAAASFKMAS
jgi:hypothetical protein